MRVRQGLLSFAFALVFLPPKKEMEDWSGSLALKDLPARSIQEITKSSDSSSSPSKAQSSKFENDSTSSHFDFNGTDKISFLVKKGSKPEWEVALPPTELQKVWDTGAWSGLSMNARTLSHFYAYQLKRGPEPKYRAYTLSPEWEAVDFAFCSRKEALLLERKLKNKKDIEYRLIRIKMLASQELKRDDAWQIMAESGQEYLSVKSDNCNSLVLEGWPKSFRVKL